MTRAMLKSRIAKLETETDADRMHVEEVQRELRRIRDELGSPFYELMYDRLGIARLEMDQMLAG
jgi:hypothetical protein